MFFYYKGIVKSKNWSKLLHYWLFPGSIHVIEVDQKFYSFLKCITNPPPAASFRDKLSSFDNGADDYLVKPFHFKELYARISSLLRRKEIPQQTEKKITIQDLEILEDDMKVFRSGEEIKLTPKEFKLILILALAKGKVLSKQFIAEKLWDYHIETNQNTIEVYINFLRKKIDKDHEIKLIRTKVGYGYYLSENE